MVARSQHAEATRLLEGQEAVVRTTRSVLPATEKAGDETLSLIRTGVPWARSSVRVCLTAAGG